MSQTASRLRALLALGVVLVPLLLAGATLAHTDEGAGIGLYNHDHDLVLMGALGAVAPLPALVVAVALVVVALRVGAPAHGMDAAAPRLVGPLGPPASSCSTWVSPATSWAASRSTMCRRRTAVPSRAAKTGSFRAKWS